MNGMNAKNTHQGFTLIEVLTILLVVAILASVGLPSMTRMLEGNRLSVNTNRLVSSLYVARSEAIKRNIQMVICTRNIAGNACGGAGVYWDKGWIVFVDNDGDGASDAGEEILNVVEKLDDSMAFAAGAPINIRFSGDGMVDADGDGQIGEVNGDTVNFRLNSDHDSRIIRLGSVGAVRACDPSKPNCP
jgi:type IV fimbrial biogenesis protein FimT